MAYAKSTSSPSVISEITEEGEYECVVGVPTRFSPAKSKASYCVGKIGDDKKSVEYRCFNSNLFANLKRFTEEKIPVEMRNVKIRKLSFAGKENLEILLNDPSSVIESAQKIQPPKTQPAVPLSDVTEIKTWYSIQIQVLDLTEKTSFRKANSSKLCYRQTATIYDETEVKTMTLWDDLCDKMHSGNQYFITDVYLDQNQQLKMEKYSRIEYVPGNLFKGDIVAAMVKFQKTCDHCKHILPKPKDNERFIKCLSCSRFLELVDADVILEAYVDVRDHSGSKTTIAVTAEKIAEILECDEKSLMKNDEDSIALLLMEKEFA